MFPPNEAEILRRIKPSDVVLDIGGWACPFNRANYVLDAEAYDTRGSYRLAGLPSSQGGDCEHFTRNTWVQRDICDKQPFPFSDKFFDFVICSHTLEDIRDPLWVCSEIVRVGKRGYIEVPSRFAESCRGWESPRIAGLTHHRWLIDIDQSSKHIRFLHKHHMIHSNRRFSFPPTFLRRLADERKIAWLFWDESFTTAELSLHGLSSIAAELESFVQSSYSYPKWLLTADDAVAGVQGLASRVMRRLTRRRKGVSSDG